MYKLPDNIDQSKIFLINRSELEGRIDPNQYHIERKEAIAKLKKNNQLLKLKEVVKNVKTTTTQVSESDIYIGLENITSNTGEYIETKDKLSISSAGIFKKGQILFPKLRPYLNKVYLAEFDGICSTEFHIFKSDTFLNEFLTIYLRSDLIVNQTKHLMTGNTLPRLQTDDINNLPVPNISIEKQQKIVDLYNIAYSKKKQKEAQAKRIIGSIDVYLLKELGITIPEKDNSLTDRIFTTKFSDISGGRFDGYFYQKDFIQFFENIKKGKYPVLTLKKISKNITSGVTPLSGGDAYTNPEEGIPFIRSGNINIDGDINFDDLLYLEKEIHNKIMKSSKVQYNDIMIAIVGATIGQVGIYLSKREANINQAIALVRLKKGNNPNYIKEVIKSSIGQYNLNRLKRPVARANINLEEIATMQLIIPHLEKQDEIANHIQSIRNQAKHLQEEALIILNQAKQQVERIILGQTDERSNRNNANR